MFRESSNMKTVRGEARRVTIEKKEWDNVYRWWNERNEGERGRGCMWSWLTQGGTLCTWWGRPSRTQSVQCPLMSNHISNYLGTQENQGHCCIRRIILTVRDKDTLCGWCDFEGPWRRCVWHAFSIPGRTQHRLLWPMPHSLHLFTPQCHRCRGHLAFPAMVPGTEKQGLSWKQFWLRSAWKTRFHSVPFSWPNHYHYRIYLFPRQGVVYFLGVNSEKNTCSLG